MSTISWADYLEQRRKRRLIGTFQDSQSASGQTEEERRAEIARRRQEHADLIREEQLQDVGRGSWQGEPLVESGQPMSVDE